MSLSRALRPAAIALCCLCHVNAGVVLVSDGEPASVIVLGNKPNPVAFEAAHELQRVIRRISGATLPIYLENEFSSGMEGPRRAMLRIFVGDSETAREAGLDLTGQPPEGFVIKTASFSPTRPSPLTHIRSPRNTHPALILAGRDDPMQNWSWRGDRANRYARGTAFAVYTFLEEDLGVRWLWPGELGEAVPRMPTISLEVPDRADAPRLTQRIFRNSRYNSSGWWQARRRVGTPLPVWTRQAHATQFWLDHLRMGDSSNQIKPSREGVVGWAEKHGDTHPEYFALQPNGDRLNRDLYDRVRLCLSHPEVIDLIANEAIAAFEQQPHLTMYGIELSDVFGSYCTCGKCRAWGPTLSELVARHWTAVAEKVAERYPDRLLYAHPYHKYVDPPQSVARIPENVVLFPVGQNLSGYTAAPDRERSIRSWLGWARLNDQRMYWRPNYPCQDAGFPLNYARQVSEDMKLFYQHKLAGVDIDHMRNLWAGEGLTYYAACKLSWNPELDIDAIIDDYCTKGFGPAASQVRAYFDAVEELTDTIARHEPAGTHPMGLPGGESAGVGLAVHYTPAVTARFHSLLDEARDAARDDATVKARIAFLRKAVEYVEIEHRVNLAGRRADAGGLTPDETRDIRGLLAERRTFLESAIGQWHIEPEAVCRGADWVEQAVDADEEKRDLFADLLLTHEEVLALPRDWRFKTDPDSVSMTEKWFAADHDESDWTTIKIGDFWERQGFKDYDGMAWYRRKLTLPAALEDRTVLFAFGAADENALVYIDGRLAGEYDGGPGGWDKRFVLDLTQHVRPGVEQTYAIRVIDSVGAGGLWKPIKVLTPMALDHLQTTVLAPTKDAWIRLNYPDTRHGTQGSLAVGSKDYFRTLIAWRLPDDVRKGRIRSARIVLPLRYSTSSGTCSAYPFRTDWDEEHVTWNNRDADHPWEDGPGGLTPLPRKPIAQSVSADIPAEQARQAETAPALVLDVSLHAHRVASEQAEFGVILVMPTAQANLSPHAREAKEPSLRPRLEIQWEPR